jgi:uncharacterized protein
MNAKRKTLRRLLTEQTPLLVAYSGGVDSAFLLAEAHEVLGARVSGAIADSPSLPRKALADALALANSIGCSVEIVRTEELENPQYSSNPINRCYFCKAELFTQLNAIAAAKGCAAIAYGENADDMRQVRPGRQAAAEFSILAPLRDAGLTKAEIREFSRELGLPTADAPAQPCLSSRIPHGTPVTPDALAMVERGEEWVRSLGFRIFRVRHIVDSAGPRARVQIAPDEMSNLNGDQISGGLLAVGYQEVEIDPAGYHSA